MHSSVTKLMALSLFLVGISGLVAWSQGSSSLSLKNRMSVPKAADLDQSVSIASLLAKPGQGDWSEKKGATLEGYVLQVEKEEDGDVVLFLAANSGETSTTNRVIVEVPPGWQKANPALSEKGLRSLLGKHVRVTGWLFYDAVDTFDPRGTPWEIHPVTAISVVN